MLQYIFIVFLFFVLYEFCVYFYKKVIFPFRGIPSIKLVSLEGNISAGKSTIINRLKEKTRDDPLFMIVDEPVDAWENVKNEKNENILDAFYKDPKDVAFTFQMCAIYTRKKSLEKAFETASKLSLKTGETVVILIERTILTDFHIFTKMLHDSGNISVLSLNTYKLWYEEFKEKFKLDKSVYLRTSPEICFERVQKRKRKGEERITLDYLKSCHNQHETFFNEVLKDMDSIVMEGDIKSGTPNYEHNIEKILEHFN